MPSTARPLAWSIHAAIGSPTREAGFFSIRIKELNDDETST